MSHVGKIYSVLTHRLAEQIYGEIPGIAQAIVWLCSRIGDPVERPQVVAVQVALDAATQLVNVEEPIGKIVKRELERMPQFCQELASGKYSIC